MPSAAPNRPRVSIDTNVFVSGLIVGRGWPFLILEAWRGNRLQLTISSSQYAELVDVLKRDHVQVRYEITDAEVNQLIRRLAREVVPDGATMESQSVRDPDDAVILATAIEYGVEFLITGDRDLLEVVEAGNARGIRIVTPRQFAEHLSGETTG